MKYKGSGTERVSVWKVEYGETERGEMDVSAKYGKGKERRRRVTTVRYVNFVKWDEGRRWRGEKVKKGVIRRDN